uniref:HAMP domain-containing protein n=1 Tax=Desertifilum tharense IPPAS B-1220 TaxID=1781255 RepID=A0ACD5GV36_9CYAN
MFNLKPPYYKALQSTALNTILLGAIALIATLSFGLLSARWLIQPILRLSAAATALAEGDWDITVPIEREDELGVLAAAFNRMAGQLQESYAALKERETKLAEAQRIAHLGNWELDLSTHRMSGSDELFRIYTIQPDSELPSYPAILEYMPPEDATQIRQAVQRALEAGEPYEVDHCIVRPNGEIRYVHSKGQPKFDTQVPRYPVVWHRN